MAELLERYRRRIAFGQWIRSKRRENQVSQEALAKALGWPNKANVSNVETGKQYFPNNLLLRLSTALGVDFGEVLRALREADQDKYNELQEDIVTYWKMFKHQMDGAAEKLDQGRLSGRGNRKGAGRLRSESAPKWPQHAFRPDYPLVDHIIHYQTLIDRSRKNTTDSLLTSCVKCAFLANHRIDQKGGSVHVFTH